MFNNEFDEDDGMREAIAASLLLNHSPKKEERDDDILEAIRLSKLEQTLDDEVALAKMLSLEVKDNIIENYNEHIIAYQAPFIVMAGWDKIAREWLDCGTMAGRYGNACGFICVAVGAILACKAVQIVMPSSQYLRMMLRLYDAGCPKEDIVDILMCAVGRPRRECGDRITDYELGVLGNELDILIRVHDPMVETLLFGNTKSPIMVDLIYLPGHYVLRADRQPHSDWNTVTVNKDEYLRSNALDTQTKNTFNGVLY